MKSLTLFAILSLITSVSVAQVSFTVIEPASIAGGYDFTSNGDGTNWGLPNLLNPADAVQDTLMLVDDGTPGLNAQGVPLANEGCGPLVNDLTGKIAVVYRYDGVSSNVCWYGTKVLNAQNAGAVGVIMINREDALIDVPGTTDGPLTTIPFAFISKSDGEILRARMDAGDDVVAFIGNKLGLYNNDVGIIRPATLAPTSTVTPALTSQNASEFGFDVGAQIYNYGTSDQNNVSITATVTGAGGTWTETAGPFSILSGDSIDVYTGGTNNLNAFSFANYPTGVYHLNYNVDIGNPDEADYDNSLSYTFVVSDSIVSFSSIDTVTMLPISNANYRAGSGAVTFNECMVYDNPNGSRLAVAGMYFSAVTGYNSGVSLAGEEIALNLYEWNDNFVDLNDANLDFANLNTVGFGYYYYPADLQDSVVYAPLDFPVQLQDNQRYLACIQTSNTDIYMGYDTRIDYDRNVNHYLQPLCPITSDGNWYALGFGTDLSPSISMQVFDASNLSVEEKDEMNINLYPNPVKDVINVYFDQTDSGTILITDLSGRIISSANYTSQYNKYDVSALAPGHYICLIMSNQGNSHQIKFNKVN